MYRDNATSTSSSLEQLQNILDQFPRVVVAFSGGVDSAFLAYMANATLGSDRSLAVTAVSPSLAATEREEASTLAKEWNLRWQTVHSLEMESAEYQKNDLERCAYCKGALMDILEPLAKRQGATVLLGVNVDDLGDHRPGQRVAAQRGARFPLLEAGFTKAEIREQSRFLGLRTWDKPAGPCLASRVPYGTPVNISTLSTVERAETGMRQLGFGELRVRHYGDTARIEVPVERLAEVVAMREAVLSVVTAAGYKYATLDLAGFRSGNLNDIHGSSS